MISCVTFVSVCRWQIYHSLAYGARGILYFYYTPEIHKDDDAGIPTWVGLVRDDGLADHVTEHWYQARRINSVSHLRPSTQTTPAVCLLPSRCAQQQQCAQAVLALGPTLMKLRSTGVVGLRYEEHAQPWRQLAGEPQR